MSEHKQIENREQKRDKVVQIINSVVSKVESVDSLPKDTIVAELKSLQTIINDAREGLGYTGAGDINSKHIPTATDELDAIVEATSMATHTIMDACEGIENQFETLGYKADPIAEHVTKIYEACSFQDITGQRISKIVSTLHDIEDKVGNLMSVLSESIPDIDKITSSEETEKDPMADESLLNGPQLEGKGVSQEDIDALLDDLFD